MPESRDIYFKLRLPDPTPEDELCHCVGQPPIKLMNALGRNPFHCMDCNLEIRPESLLLGETLVEKSARWNSLADAIYRLWLDSDAYESWARDELSNIGSTVNQLGLSLRGELVALRQCYYWYFQDQSSEEYLPLRQCPRCGDALQPYSAGIFEQLTCEGCGIVVVSH